MSRKKIVIVGTNFAGYTAAIELRELVGDSHDITVVANTHHFLFFPSLIWLPFGKREEEDITFDVRPVYRRFSIDFIEAEVERFDPQNRLVLTTSTDPIAYDYLLIATGPKVDYDYIPGFREHGHCIVGLKPAQRVREAWRHLLEHPGPVIVGAPQGAACFGAAYEFLFNARYDLARHNLSDRVPLTFLTAEPFLAHFGIGGFGNAQHMAESLFGRYDIRYHVNTEIREVRADSVVLGDGQELPSALTMLIPRFLGIDAVRATPGLGNANGFIETTDGYQHKVFPEIYAAGVAVHVAPPGPTPVPCGVPETGYPSEQMAKTAVKNIVADIKGLPHVSLPFGEMHSYCIMDTGNMGMMIIGDHMFSPREHEFIIPGPEAHWAKVAFEKYFLFTRKHAHV